MLKQNIFKRSRLDFAISAAVTVLASMTFQPVYSAQVDDQPFYDSYQLALLYNPTAAQLQMEQQGRVNIYVGMTDKQVDSVMDRQFDRIDSMMFVSVIRTDEAGNTLKDENTGEVLVEEDGCD
jgi:hypothetical protein